MKHLVLFSALISAICTFELDFFDNEAFPSDILVSVDESIYIKLKNPIEGLVSECTYKAPGRKQFNTSEVFLKFSDDVCGIQIEKVQKLHAGAWKLISTFKNSSHQSTVKGISIVRVKERVIFAEQDNQLLSISSMEDFSPLTQNEMSYCYVSKDLGLRKILEIEKSKCMIPEIKPDFQEGKIF